MFHRTQLAGHHDAVRHNAGLETINNARAADGLQPFSAPSGRSQMVAAAIMVAVTAFFILLLV